jgi:hypothetical protein
MNILGCAGIHKSLVALGLILSAAADSPGATLTHRFDFERETVEDSVGSIAGKIAGFPRFVPGRIGEKAIFLDGDADSIELAPMELGEAFSISLWIKPAIDGFINIQPLLVTGDFRRESQDPGRFYLHVNNFHTSDGQVELVTREGGGSRAPATAVGAVTAGLWYWLAVTVDLARTPPGVAPRDRGHVGTVQIYVNGAEATIRSVVTKDLSRAPKFVLGTIPGTGFRYRGAIDDLRFYSGVLSPEEIKSLAAAPQGADKSDNKPVMDVPPADQILHTLRKNQHPRIILTPERLDRLKENVKIDERAKKWYELLRKAGDDYLKAPPIKYPGPGKQILLEVRQSLEVVECLALLYRLTGDRRYAERAWAELEALAGLPDWHPDHWLDTAEACATAAVGYDWLFDALSDRQRATLRKALIDNGLQVGLDTYMDVKKYGWWRVTFNWNQVCNGGVMLGALAVADEEPVLAGKLIRYGLLSLPRALVQFAPDGASIESPAYWDYAQLYTAMALSGLHDSLGSDFGLTRLEGVRPACDYPLHVCGPFGVPFNYNDSGADPIPAAEMFWFAAFFDRPEWAKFAAERVILGPQAHPHLALNMIWYDPRLIAKPAAAAPLDRYFREAELVTMRGAWNDVNSSFLAFKGGDNHANHAHLQEGSFVFDALGYRWAWQDHPEGYGRPGWFDFDGARWNYYRARAEGHNTLVINPGSGPDQELRARCRVIRFEPRAGSPWAILDLTPAYSGRADEVRRGFKLIDRKRALIQDEIQAQSPVEVWWFMHTTKTATVAADGRRVTLEKLGKRVVAKLRSPAKARFVVIKAEPLASSPKLKQTPEEGVWKLAIHLTQVTKARIAVELVPLTDSSAERAAPAKVVPLAEW